MALSTAIRSSEQERLEALRSLDQFREWRSVDEKRYCLVCGRIITGRQIQVMRGTGSKRLLRLSCPTQGCNSVPMDWVLPTIETLARIDSWLRKEATS